MPLYVRKLAKRKNIDLIGKTDDICNMFADVATSEFRTTNGTLSIWGIEDIEKLDEAVLAIAATSNKIDRMDFVVIDPHYIYENGLEYENTYAGQEIAIPDLQGTHYDIKGITLIKLQNCVHMYREIYDSDNNQERYIVRYTEREIKKLLNDAIAAGRVRKELLSKDIREALA